MAERTGRELTGTAVMTLTGGERLGRIEDVLFDGATGHLLGFTVSADGLFAKPRYLPIGLVQSLGADAVTISDADALQHGEGHAAEQAGVSAKSLDGRPVLNASGSVIGKVTDYLVDDQAMTVALSLGTGLLDNALHGRPRLPIPTIQARGRDSIIVPDSYDPKAATSR